MNYHCEICGDTGYIIYEQDGYMVAKSCNCQKIRKSLYLAEKSGLGGLLNTCTFDRFTVKYDFQKDLYNKAMNYTQDETNSWFCLLGKTGSGKTHICTAICKAFLQQGNEVRFMSWLEESRRLKAVVNEIDYDYLIRDFKTAEILYIDDFFKSENNTPPSSADIKLANEIINYRYNKARSGKKCKTIISSERTLEQLVKYDEAIAGRIVEMSQGYIKVLTDKNSINYRLKSFLTK